MATHPLWRPFELVDLDEVAKVVVTDGPPRTIEVVAYDAGWPAQYEAVHRRIVAALGNQVLALEHVGSTAVSGLAAKPVIDVDLTVVDSGDELAYLSALEATGFVLKVREPDWEEHRVLAIEDPQTNLHVFSPGAREPQRHLVFRDWLRTHSRDRKVYGNHKTELARRGFTHGMDYNNYKAALVYDIYEKAFAADPAHEHAPRPR